MDGKVLVIVESPTKAKTIRKFLPANYIVEASVGHIRDLPQSAAEIPKKYKGESWAKLGIDVDHDFYPLYVTPQGKGKTIKELKSKLKDVEMLLLATDEDREGESISWHLLDVLAPKVPCKRMVFHEITKSAIQKALASGRDLDMNLVNAQETRRILDRLYGYTLSPLLWKKIAFGLSAGRVQSPGLRLLVERERERILFSSSSYWDLKALLVTQADASFEARLEYVDGLRIAGSKDFDSKTGEYKGSDKIVRLDEQGAKQLAEELEPAVWVVTDVQEKAVKIKPAPPFITSTLQQEGNRKLRLSARDTMRTAQKLYEKGFITYMRTDSPVLSDEGLQAARNAVSERYGKQYLPESPRSYASQSLGAQEAHEAIRPAGEVFITPDETGLEGRELALYSLIYKRTLACQMHDAEKASTTVKLGAGRTQFSATGTRIIFPGFIKVYVEGSDDSDNDAMDTSVQDSGKSGSSAKKEVLLPELVKDQKLQRKDLIPLKHETKPPARFTEASLVKELEKLGIGRPSTYASIINTLFDRKYIRRQGTALIPTLIGFGVIQLLERNFEELIQYSFTSEMEGALDEIAVGKIDKIAYLNTFYHGKTGLRNRVDQQEKKIKTEQSRTILLPQLVKLDGIKIGKFGPYIVVKDPKTGEELHASLPEELAPADITEQSILELIENQSKEPEPVYHHPETGEPIFLMNGRFGPYFQLGLKNPENPNPKRASVPAGQNSDSLSLEEILNLLSLPRELGPHPETGSMVTANNGRFGPYVSHNGEFRSLKKSDDLYTVTLERAVEILAEPKVGRGGNVVLVDFGIQANGESLAIYQGKYGCYIKSGKKNISLPEVYKKDPEKAKLLTREDIEKIIKK